MTLEHSARQRADWIRAAHKIQLEIADLRLHIDAAMGAHPLPEPMRLMAQADVHLERASSELVQATDAIRSIT